MKLIPGSLTVEASIALPVFIFTIACFLYLGQMLIVQSRLQSAMEIAGQKAAIYSYGMDSLKNSDEGDSQKLSAIGNAIGDLLTSGISSAYLKAEIIKIAGEDFLDHSCMKGGSQGISLLGSEVSEKETVIDLIVSYKMTTPLGIDLRFTQRCRKRSWIGSDEIHSEIEEKVYITENGTVYHSDRNCTYIAHKIQPVPFGKIEGMRNNSGAKYYPCESCMSNSSSSTVYITPNGTRYHSRITCSRITPAVKTVSISEVGAMPACKKCGGSHK